MTNFDQKTIVQEDRQHDRRALPDRRTILKPSKDSLLIEAKVISLLTTKVVVTARARITNDDILDGEQVLVAKLIAGLADDRS